MERQTLILFCRCAVSEAMPRENVDRAAEILAAGDVPHVLIDDLCGVIAQLQETPEDAVPRPCHALSDMIGEAKKVVVVACEPRAVSSLIAWGGIEVDEKFSFINLRDAGMAENLSSLLKEIPLAGPVDFSRTTRDDWIPWFPVIDFQRCIDCGKCYDFCLFGVYEEEDGRIVVRNPQKCKNKCPACARVCPVQAVIFPKFEQAPINGGEISAKSAESAKAGATGQPDDVLAAKKARRKKLFSEDFERKLQP